MVRESASRRVVRQGQSKSHYTSLDVSKMAGVGRATVSRYLNNPHLLSEETLKKVKNAVEVLNYRPSAAARGLVNGRLKVVGFVTDISNSLNQAEYMPAVVDGLVEKEYCLSVSTIPMWTKISEIEKSPIFLQNHVDGFIFNTEYLIGDIRSFCTTFRVPSVFINASEPYPYDCVIPDDVSVSGAAMAHLYQNGHRRIAYLGGTSTGHKSSIGNRQQGYGNALLRANLNPMPFFDAMLPPDQPDILKEVERRMEIWFGGSEPATAILTYDPSLALVVMKVAHNRDWAIPEKFSLMTCDDWSVLQYLPVAVSAVGINRGEIGSQAVKMLMQRMEYSGEIPTIKVPGVLRARESVRRVEIKV